MNRPNILYLHCHDAGRWIEPYGYPVSTPHLNRFARQSTLFRKAFCVAPTCGPSRAALLSGQYPHQVGVFGLPGASGWQFDNYDKHLVNVLGGMGYDTALAGCQHETDKRESSLRQLGYHELLSERELKGQFYPETINRVESYLAKRRGISRPFFLSVGIDEPHRNNQARPEVGVGDEAAIFSKTRYYDPDELDSRYTAPPPWLPDLPEIRRDLRSYAEGVKIMDDYMGRVLDCLRHHGMMENTVIIATTDHGIEYPGAKKTLSDQGLGVFLMMSGPGIRKGAVVESMVSQLDVYPTLLDLMGEPDRPWLEGVSFAGALRGEPERAREVVFAEQTYHDRLEALRCVRTERYKLVQRHAQTGPLMRHDGPPGEVMERLGWYERNSGPYEFYDLYLDPQEACNRMADPCYQEAIKSLQTRLMEELTRRGDPFLSGAFPSPPGQQP